MSTPAQPQARDRPSTSERLTMVLFVSGTSPASVMAERRLRDICDRHWPAGYDLRIVDIYQEPAMVVSRGVLAVPTLIKELPPPAQVLIGDFTDEPRVLAALGFTTAAQS